MARAKNRKQPSHYPGLPFHLIRFCAFICSLIVASFLSFFVYHLKHDSFQIPWTFLVLIGVALFTLIVLAVTSIVHCCHVLSPLMNLIANFILLILWIVGLGLLGWNMAGTLGHVCNTVNWGSSAGIMVCRIYKALFVFTLFATISTLGMIILDVRTRRKQNSLGKYDQMRDSTLDLKPLKSDFRSAHNGRDQDDRPAWMVADHHEPGGSYHSREVSRDDLHHDEPQPAWLREEDGRRDPYQREDPLQPWQSTSRYDHDSQTQDPSREPIRASDFGYAAPPQQTHYDGGTGGNYSDRRHQD